MERQPEVLAMTATTQSPSLDQIQGAAERESIYETVMDVPPYESSHYRHVRNVEAMIASHPKWFAEFTGDLDEPDEDNMNDAIQPPDEVFEQWSANPKF